VHDLAALSIVGSELPLQTGLANLNRDRPAVCHARLRLFGKDLNIPNSGGFPKDCSRITGDLGKSVSFAKYLMSAFEQKFQDCGGLFSVGRVLPRNIPNDLVQSLP
jgi:hypothetical protein